MKIKVVIEDTEPAAKEGTWVWVSGQIDDQKVDVVIDGCNLFLLRALNSMRVLQVKTLK